VKVLVSGYLGMGNLGDEAIFAAIAEGLAWRRHQVEALSGDPAETRALHGVAAARRLIGLPWALGRAEALVSGGGGLLQDGTSRRSLRYYLGVIRAARASGLRVVVFAQSIGPLSPAGRRMVARALRGLPVAVRDVPSQQLLDELGIASTLVADAALALPLPAERPRGGLLLVPRADVADAREGLATLARERLAAGEQVEVLALQRGADELDADRIVAEAPGTERLRAAGPAEALALCARAGKVVSVRLHGLVFAARAGVPHLGVAYDPKVRGFVSHSGGAAVEVPVVVEELRAALLRLGAIPDARRDELVARAHDGLGWLDRALRTPDGPQ